LNQNILPEDKHEEAVKKLLSTLSGENFHQSPASLGRKVHRIIREITDNPDPYRAIKDKSNVMMLEHEGRLRKKIFESDDPRSTALRLAIAGNVIDYGPQDRLDIWETIERILNSDLARDDSAELFNEIRSAKQILYVGDNCGEIVMDMLFIETINHENLFFAVRESPVINDATKEDALDVGIDRFAKIITTGDNAPGAIWEDSSEEFRKVLLESDVVISKGQGNFEGLSDVNHPIYFLLVAKCDLVAKELGVKKGDFVVKKFYSKSADQK